MEASEQQKQSYLRTQIMEGGFDPQRFVEFMAAFKQGQQIKIQNWSMSQLQNLVRLFKEKTSIRSQLRPLQETIEIILPSRQITQSIIMQARESHSRKKFYYNEKLWDYQMKSKQNCKKIKNRIDLSSITPKIDYHHFQIKKTSGYLFGLVGSRDELWLEIMTNFTPNKVQRKSQDFDWLRKTLVKKNIGAYVPPLQQFYTVQAEDKVGVNNRVKAIVQFMNSLANFDYLIQSKYVYQFLTETDYARFGLIKKKEDQAKILNQIGAAQTVSGVFDLQISQRTAKMTKCVSKFSAESQVIYCSLQTNIIKILSDLQTIIKHTQYVTNDFAKLHDNFNALAKQAPQLDLGNTATILVYLNNLFNTLNGHTRTQMRQIKDVLTDFAKLNHKQWKQFSTYDKKRESEFKDYLQFKDALIKKKEKLSKDPKMWELTQVQLARVQKMNLQTKNSDQIFELMLPKQNEQEQEKRVWVGFLNFKYEKSFNLLVKAQEKRYIDQFKKYDEKMRVLKNDQMEAFNQFREIVGIQQQNVDVSSQKKSQQVNSKV